MEESVLSTSVGRPVGTKGFVDPETIADNFLVQEGMKVADFGSGAGYFSIIIAQRVGPEGKVYAIDVQQSALDIVKGKARAGGLENIEPIRANLEVIGSTGLAGGSQDMVLVANVLFQSKDKIDIIREARRILKDSGRIIIIDWKKGAGGFGPPDELRLSEDETRKIADEISLELVSNFDPGEYYLGAIYGIKKKN